MELLIKIAWRNIMRHRGKSLVIGAILFVGALLMTIGNGVISGMDKGLHENIVSGFTGDIVLVSDKQESDVVIIDMMGKSIEEIHNYKSIDTVLQTVSFVEQYLPIGKNGAMVLNEEGGSPGFTYILGVDFEKYRAMFPATMRAIEGRLFEPGERGVLVPTGARKEMLDATNIWFLPEGLPVDTANMTAETKAIRSNLVYKDSVVFMGMNPANTSTDVRLGIKGIIKYNALNTIWGHFSLVDIESYRQCLGYITASEKAAVVLSAEDKLLFGDDDIDLDNLFSDAALKTTGVDRRAVDKAPKQAAVAAERVVHMSADPDDGTYNLVLLRLKDHKQLDQSVKQLNDLLKEKQLGVRAVSWKKATGTIGSMAVLIKTALFLFVMFLFFVAIIIIVNTLSMAALERTAEIGMMRAVGARKGFISTMFFGETALLAACFGGLGILTGFVVVKILVFCNFTTDNDMVQLLYGGDTFQPFLSVGAISLAAFQLAIVTLVAVIYPMYVARSITPLDAIARD